jgi:hypothetical protein
LASGWLTGVAAGGERGQRRPDPAVAVRQREHAPRTAAHPAPGTACSCCLFLSEAHTRHRWAL